MRSIFCELLPRYNSCVLTTFIRSTWAGCMESRPVLNRPDEWVVPAKAAEFLGVSPAELKRLRSKGLWSKRLPRQRGRVYSLRALCEFAARAA